MLTTGSRSFQRGTVSLCRSKGCKDTVRQTLTFDVTSKQDLLHQSSDLSSDTRDLNLMVRGTGGAQVASVCSQVEAPRTVDQVSY